MDADTIRKAIKNWKAAPASRERTQVLRGLNIRLKKFEAK